MWNIFVRTYMRHQGRHQEFEKGVLLKILNIGVKQLF